LVYFRLFNDAISPVYAQLLSGWKCGELSYFVRMNTIVTALGRILPLPLTLVSLHKIPLMPQTTGNTIHWE
jgi:hypothetical protein